MSRMRLGGDKHFAYFNQDYDHAEFLLKKYDNPPKLDGFIQGQRFRIEIETQSDKEVYKISLFQLLLCVEQTQTVQISRHT